MIQIDVPSPSVSWTVQRSITTQQYPSHQQRYIIIIGIHRLARWELYKCWLTRLTKNARSRSYVIEPKLRLRQALCILNNPTLVNCGETVMWGNCAYCGSGLIYFLMGVLLSESVCKLSVKSSRGRYRWEFQTARVDVALLPRKTRENSTPIPYDDGCGEPGRIDLSRRV